MPKQQPAGRLDSLLQAGLKPKEQTQPQPPKALPESKQERVPVYKEELQTLKDVPQEPTNEQKEPTNEQKGGRLLKSDEDKATEKVTAYFTPEQYDKIEDLRRAHRKKTGKRISVNELLRRLVENAEVQNIIRN